MFHTNHSDSDTSDDDIMIKARSKKKKNTSTTTNTNTTIIKQSCFRMNPTSIYFNNCEPSILYTSIFEIQNISNKMKKLRIINPISRSFTVNVNLEKPLSPGLTLEISVNFIHINPISHHDKFILLSDDEKFEIPLHAYCSLPDIQFNNTLSLGPLIYNSAASKNFEIKNNGNCDGNYTFICSDDTLLKFIPNTGNLLPGETKVIKVEALTNKLGPLREIVQVLLREDMPPKLLDVVAIIMEPSLEFCNVSKNDAMKGTPITNIDFGTNYIGNSLKYKGVIVNSSPKPASYSITMQYEDEEKRDDSVILILPSEGMIDAFGKVEISLHYNPTSNTKLKGNLLIESIELKQSLQVPIEALSLSPNVSLSQNSFEFGDCAVNDRSDMICSITNKSEDLPVKFNFEKIAHFTFTPQVGKLSPLHSQDILITFSPHQLGEIFSSSFASFENGLQKINLKFHGVANQAIGRKIVHGIDKLPIDFKPTMNYVKPETIHPDVRLNKTKTSNFKRTPAWEDSDVLSNLNSLDAAYTYSVGELQGKMNHKNQYKDFLEESRTIRVANNKKAEREKLVKKGLASAPDDDLNLGFDFAEGLNPPPLSIQQVNSVISSSTFETLDDNRKKHIFDELHLIKKKFKTKPTTSGEVRECSTILSPEVLNLIKSGPKIIDLGSVCVRSKTFRNFTVVNPTEQNILVSLDFSDCIELKESTPVSQIVPAGGTAGFDIVFTPSSVQDFRRSIIYLINECHRFSFSVIAQVVPINISLSTDSLQFNFSRENLTFSTSSSLKLTNSVNTPAEYIWSVPNNLFTVTPDRGVIEPNRSIQTKVTYRPKHGTTLPNNQIELTLKVGGGAEKQVICKVENSSSPCVLSEKKINFGTVPVGSVTERSVTLRNTGTTFTVFQAIDLPRGIKVSPSSGVLNVGSRVELTISLSPSEEGSASPNISFEIRNEVTQRLSISYDAILPDIHVVQDEIEFGDVTCGMSKFHPLSIENRGKIASTIYLDFSNLSDFTLTYDSSLSDVNDENKTVSVSKVSSATVRQTLKGIFSGTSALLSMDNNPKIENDGGFDEEDNAYMLYISPGSTIEVNILFKPVIVNEYTVELPLFLSGLPNYAPLRRVLHANTLHARVSILPSSFDFGTRVVLKREHLFSGYSQNIVIKNEQDTTLQWVLVPGKPSASSLIDNVEVQQLVDIGINASTYINRPTTTNKPNKSGGAPVPLHNTWKIEPCFGHLPPFQSITVTVSYSPVEPYYFALPLDLFLDDQKEIAYSTINVKGTGTFPTIHFDRSEIILPCVPLQCISTAMFFINNDGYDNLDLQYNIPSNIPITLRFPDGQCLSTGSFETIAVEVSFVSSKPFSFTSSIEFIDNIGAKFSIPISGTTDNSLFSVQQYLDTNESFIEYLVSDDKPTRIVDRSSSADHENMMGAISSKDLEEYSTINSSVLLDFLVASRLFYSRSSFKDFPLDLVKTNGRALIDLVEFLSGKSIRSNIQPANAKANKKEAITQLLSQYEALIFTIKSFGGLLNTVRPEYLLTFTQFVRVNNSNSSEASRQNMEHIFPSVSKNMWLELIYQTVKVFILSRVNLKSFKAIQAPTDNIPINEAYLDASNIFSSSELLLLKWVEFQHNKYNPLQIKKVTNFTKDFRDCILLSSLLTSYLPQIKATKNINSNPTTDEHLIDNANMIVSAFEEFGFNWQPSLEFFLKPNARNMMLLVLFLFNNLPSFVPKTTIEFTGRLQEEITKTIELSNPSKMPILYSIKLEGSSDFSIERNEVRLEGRDSPASKISFPIRIKPRLTKPVEAKIFFVSVPIDESSNSSEKNTNKSSRFVPPQSAATLVFNLKTNITSRKAIQTFNTESKIYEPAYVDIELENIFGAEATYNVSFVQSAPAIPEKKEKNVKKNKNAQNNSSNDLNNILATIKHPDAFFCRFETIKVKGSSPIKFQVQFLPFILGEHSCQILLVDENVGEMMIEIYGNGNMPSLTETVRTTMENKPTISKDFTIPFKNSLYEKAKTIALDRFSPAIRAKEGLKYNYPSPLVYTTELSSPLFSTAAEFQITDSNIKDVKDPKEKENKEEENSAKKNDKKDDKDKNKVVGASKFQFSLTPKGAGVYTSDLIIRSPFDIRIYKLELEITSQPTFASLEFVTPARSKVIQEIPIINNSNNDWSFTAIVNGSAYSGPRDIAVRKKSSQNYLLVFAPNWVGEHNGSLILTNAKTGEKASYDLTGTGEEPLAEDSIKIKCKTRKIIEQKFIVKNYEKLDVVYNIESDLPFISGPSKLSVPANSTAEYIFKVNAKLGGNYHGSVTFIPPSGQFLWYAVDIETEAPTPESEIEVKSYLRKAVAVELTLSNPLTSTVEFDVFIEGDGLFGDQSFKLAPKQTATYELVFSPMSSGKQNGSIRFVSASAGEFWYKLLLIGEKAPPIELTNVICEIGKTEQVPILLDNPSDYDVVLSGSLTNNRNFSISPSTISIPPFEKRTVMLTYNPSSLNTPQPCEIIFSHPNLGEWNYKIKGLGQEPNKKEVISIATLLGQKINAGLPFRNPFDLPLSFKVQLKHNEKKNFSIVMKSSASMVDPNSVFQIPYSFLPNSMTDCMAEIHVESTNLEKNITWIYLIKGVAESSLVMEPINLNCQARKTLDSFFEIQLPGLGDGPLTIPEEFTYELIFPKKSPVNLNFLTKCLNIKLQNSTLYHGQEKLKFLVDFEPLRPIHTILELTIEKKSGGRWRFQVYVDVADPPIDDTIKIQSAIHKTSSVTFKLTNQFNAFAEYQAFLSQDSPFEFTVSPSSGILPPHGSEGIPFVVSFTSHEYGKLLSGRLIVLTEDMQWTFLIQGTHPSTVTPNPASSIDNVLSRTSIEKMQVNKLNSTNTNFLKANAKKLKDMSK